ncbi:MAG: hypothetical protein ABI763_13990, partial [Bacteroidota bacterium]
FVYRAGCDMRKGYDGLSGNSCCYMMTVALIPNQLLEYICESYNGRYNILRPAGIADRWQGMP